MTGVWFGFTRSHDTIIALNVPIEYVNRPPNFEILDCSVDEVRLQLYGSSALIRSLRPGQVQARIDLSKATEGRNLFPVTQDNIMMPPGVFLNKVQPSTVEVTLDIPVTKELPVQVDWVGRLPENLTMKSVSTFPETVKVIGGSKILEKAATVYTVPVRLDYIAKSGSVTTTIVLTPPSLKLAQSSSERVTIHFAVEERAGLERR
jgi:YbbR domain-containing protein